jgi:5'-nucleotidase
LFKEELAEYRLNKEQINSLQSSNVNMTRRKKILLTNDDGINSKGLLPLYRELSTFADVTVITPNIQRSGESKAITINTILRVEETELLPKVKAYTISGTAADGIIYALHKLPERPFDFVVAGINQGLNVSSHIIMTSGTCAAAFEASFYGIPAVAFSMKVPETNFFVTPEENVFHSAAKVAARITKQLIDKVYPQKMAFLNVNFPEKTTSTTPIVLTTLAKRLIVFKPYEYQDPRNNDYFFLWGDIAKEVKKGSDVHAILEDKISVTPITNDLTLNSNDQITNFVEKMILEKNE